mmetsp:Transcript_30262/g.76115  ORF Transcript_30262/g.76115 Transcript_30262/m.76115 type:complete len:234 (-) Transcript_30262:189-890(-)
MIQTVTHAHQREQLLCTFATLCAGPRSLQEHGQLDVLDGGQRRDQVEGLEHEADAPQTQRCSLRIGGVVRDSLAAQIETALGGLIDGADDVQQRALAAARGAEHTHELTTSHSERDAAQRRNALHAQQVGLVHVVHIHDQLRVRSQSIVPVQSPAPKVLISVHLHGVTQAAGQLCTAAAVVLPSSSPVCRSALIVFVVISAHAAATAVCLVPQRTDTGTSQRFHLYGHNIVVV